MSFLFSGLISIMSTDRGTIISPHISPTLSIDTGSKKPVINLVQYFPKARALTVHRQSAGVFWKWLSKSVIVKCVMVCNASCNVACIGIIGSWESDQCKSSQNSSSAPNWCFQIIVTKEWNFSSSAPTHSMVKGEISDNDGILHLVWSGQFKMLNQIPFQRIV